VRALLCTQYGPPDLLELHELPGREPGDGEVVVSVKAASLNFPDVLIIQNKYQFKPPLPFSPGNELAGVVKTVGAGVRGFEPGDRVMAFVAHGAFAEEITLDQSRLLPMPERMDFPTAASLLVTYGTMVHALKDRAALARGETLAVLGASGGVGLAAVELGKAMGARVIACASSDDKLSSCVAHGADDTINYATEDLRERIKTLTAGRGIDVVADPVGGPYTEPALRSLAWRGRFLVVGFTAGEIPKIPLNLPLLKGCSIVGVFWGDFLRREPANGERDVQELVALYRAGRIRPLVSARYALEHTADALHALMQRKVQGKVVVVP
jgi:NADPH2:quinone reductase